MPKRVILILQLLDAKNKPQENQGNDFSTMHKKVDSPSRALLNTGTDRNGTE